jgi:purine-binding chemotaxis protein CheW
MKAVFRQRAIQLASERAEARPAAPGIPALIFRLALERYAIPLQELAEVQLFKGCTQVPGSSSQFLGVINLRGELRPVIDLSRVLSGSGSTDSGAVLILRRPAALKVDLIEELREIRSDEVTPPAEGRYIRALMGSTLALLDVETMLAAVFSAKETRSL